MNSGVGDSQGSLPTPTNSFSCSTHPVVGHGQSSAKFLFGSPLSALQQNQCFISLCRPLLRCRGERWKEEYGHLPSVCTWVSLHVAGHAYGLSEASYLLVLRGGALHPSPSLTVQGTQQA